jgi:hypothetical protein
MNILIYFSQYFSVTRFRSGLLKCCFSDVTDVTESKVLFSNSCSMAPHAQCSGVLEIIKAAIFLFLNYEGYQICWR